jgi:hypothetical protein
MSFKDYNTFHCNNITMREFDAKFAEQLVAVLMRVPFHEKVYLHLQSINWHKLFFLKIYICNIENCSKVRVIVENIDLRAKTKEYTDEYPGSRGVFLLFSLRRGRGKINLWLKAAIDSSSRANQF